MWHYSQYVACWASFLFHWSLSPPGRSNPLEISANTSSSKKRPFFSSVVGLHLTLWTYLFGDLDFQIKTRFSEGRHTEHRCLTKLETWLLRKNTVQHQDVLRGWPHPLANSSLLQSVFMEWIVTHSCLLATYLKTARRPKNLLIFINPRHSHAYIFNVWASSECREKQTQQKQRWQATRLSSQAPFQLPRIVFVIREWWVDARLGVAWDSMGYRLDR